MKSRIPGIVFSFFIGMVAYLGALYIPMINSIVLALIMGMLYANIAPTPEKWSSGIHFSSKNLLEIAIIFLGFGISFYDIASLGWQIIIVLSLSILVVLGFTYFIVKRFNIQDSCGHLIGFGTAICGSSAIAALAPKLNSGKSEIGISIAVINLYGLIGMLAFPIVFSSDIIMDAAALMIGGTLHGVSNVAGAGYAMGETIGDLSLTIKLGRVALLAPALIFFNFLINRNASIKENLKLPYYIVGFILASSMITFFQLPVELIEIFRIVGKALLTISMAAIGLSIHFKQLYTQGKNALGFGALIFAFQILILGMMTYLIT
ncbi:putative sulfate exporter family transporter [bacterium SCSIO 12643]|nr:putative sulfate exporter family transporter [bacterium SCSIO 12643]